MGSRNDDIGVFGHTIVPAKVNANGTHHRDDLTKLLHIVVFGGLLAHRHQLPKLRLVRKEVGGLDQPLELVMTGTDNFGPPATTAHLLARLWLEKKKENLNIEKPNT